MKYVLIPILFVSSLQAAQNQEVAKKIADLSYNQDNPYLQRLMARSLDNQKRRDFIIQLYQDPRSKHIRKRLKSYNKSLKHEALRQLQEEQPDENLLREWLLSEVLVEKIQDRILLCNSNCWKYINGVAAALLPIITFVVQFVINKYTQSDEKCDCSSGNYTI